MRLKEFFKLLAKADQKIELYFTQENRDPSFGFKINGIDYEQVLQNPELSDLHYQIWLAIENAFLNTNLIDDGEGNTSYFLKSDLSCIKKASYFDWVTETEKDWINENITEFNFGTVELPTYTITIIIYKNSTDFIIRDERELKEYLSEELFNDFSSFYELLLNEFQEIEIELELEQNDENEIVSNILEINGSYEEIVSFDLLDNSNLDIPKDELKIMLTKYFRIDPPLASQILNEKEE